MTLGYGGFLYSVLQELSGRFRCVVLTKDMVEGRSQARRLPRVCERPSVSK